MLPEEPHEQPEETSVQKANTGFPKSVAVAKTAARFETDDTTTASETNANLTKKKKNFTKKATATNRPSTTAGNNHNNNNNNLENPVENIRKQLEKLEDLGDQLPSNETAYTLRYPFQDKGEFLQDLLLCIVKLLNRTLTFSSSNTHTHYTNLQSKRLQLKRFNYYRARDVDEMFLSLVPFVLFFSLSHLFTLDR